MAKKLLFEIEVDAQFQDLVRLQTEMDKLNKEQKELSKQGQKNTTTFQKNKIALKELGAQHRDVSKQIKTNNVAAKNLDKSYNGLTARNRKLSQALRQLQDPLGKDIKEFRRLSTEINKNTSNLKRMDKAMGRSQRNVGNYGSGLKGMGKAFLASAGGALVLIGGIRGIISIGTRAIKAVGEQEKVEKSLEVALGRRSKALLNQASALQKTTKFGDEATIQAQAFLAQMNLTEEQILKITPSLLDFAEAQGISLADAGKLLAKSLGSSTNALSRYGIEIKGAVGSNERLDSAIDNLNDKFKGQAVAAAKVGTGAITQFENTLGDLEERIGSVLINALNPFIQGLGNFIKSTDDSSDASFENAVANKAAADQSELLLAEYEDLTKEGVIPTAKEKDRLNLITLQLRDRLGESVVAINAETGALELNTEAVREQIKLKRFAADEEASTIASRLKGAQDELKIQEANRKSLEIEGKIRQKNVLDLNKQLGTIDDFRKANKEERKEIEKTQKKLSDAQSARGKFFKRERINFDKIDELRKQEIKLLKQLTDLNFTQADVDDFLTIKKKKNAEKTNKRLDITSKKTRTLTGLIELQAAAVKKLQEQRLRTKDKEKIATLADDIREAENKLKELQSLGVREEITLKISSDVDVDFKAIQKKLEEDKNKPTIELDVKPKFSKEEIEAIKQEVTQASLTIAKSASDALFEQAQANNQRTKQFEIDQLEILSQRQEDVLKSRLDSGLISQAEFENNRIALEEETQAKRFEIEKSAFNKKKDLDTKQAIINGALAITRILADTPKVDFGIATAIQIGLAIATTGIQVAAIRSQQFARGGKVLSGERITDSPNIATQTNGDNILATVKQGEVVLNERQQQALGGYNTFRNIGVPGFSSGGLARYTPPAFAGGGLVSSGSTSQLDLDRQARTIIEGINTIKVVNVATETADVAANVANIEDEFTI